MANPAEALKELKSHHGALTPHQFIPNHGRLMSSEVTQVGFLRCSSPGSLLWQRRPVKRTACLVSLGFVTPLLPAQHLFGRGKGLFPFS